MRSQKFPNQNFYQNLKSKIVQYIETLNGSSEGNEYNSF